MKIEMMADSIYDGEKSALLLENTKLCELVGAMNTARLYLESAMRGIRPAVLKDRDYTAAIQAIAALKDELGLNE